MAMMPTDPAGTNLDGNQTTPTGDLVEVRCDAWQDAISASADGEDPGVEPRLLDAHLAVCATCRAFAAAIDASRRAVLQPSPEMPDLSAQVSKLTAVADRASRWGVIRALLVVVAVEVIALSLPSLVLGDGDSGVHDGRHLGAFTIAYGVSLLVVAVRPARARTVLPVAAVLGGALLITTVVDLARGAVPLVAEATHLPELVSVLLVWLLAVPAPRRSTAASVPPARPALRLVGDDAGDDHGRHAV